MSCSLHRDWCDNDSTSALFHTTGDALISSVAAVNVCLHALHVNNTSEFRHPGVFLQEGEQLVKKVGGVFAFKVKDGPNGSEATWVVDVKNAKGSVTNDPGMCLRTYVLL